MAAVVSNPNGHGHILRSLLLFGEVLRKMGLDVGSGNMLDMVRAIEYAPFGRKQDFRQAARCILVHRKQDLPLFDEAFEVFWRKPATRQINRDIKSLGEERRYRRPEVGRRRLARSWAPLIQVKAARLATASTYPGPIAHARSCGPRTSRTLRPRRFPTPAG